MKNKDAIEALVNADGCFQAALAEGIKDKMEDLPDCEEVYAFLDVYTRRIMQAHLHIIEALQSLTQAQEKPSVDVEWLVDDIEDVMSNTNDVDVTLHDFAKAVANHLHEQGHLNTLSEDYAIVPKDAYEAYQGVEPITVLVNGEEYLVPFPSIAKAHREMATKAANQGHLRSSEKPTYSTPEGYDNDTNIKQSPEWIGEHVKRGWIAFDGALYSPKEFAVVPVEPTKKYDFSYWLVPDE